jgi:hypothetical protein
MHIENLMATAATHGMITEHDGDRSCDTCQWMRWVESDSKRRIELSPPQGPFGAIRCHQMQKSPMRSWAFLV